MTGDLDYGRLVQGQIVHLDVLPLLTSNRHPHTAAGIQAAENPGSGPLGLRLAARRVDSGLVMLATQTCDLQPRRGQDPQWVQVAPIHWVETSDALASSARKRLSPGRIHVPWVSGTKEQTATALLSELTAIDAGVLRDCELGRQPSAAQARELAECLGRFWSRPALPDDQVAAMQPLIGALRRGKPASLRQLLEEHVDRVRVLLTDDPSHCSILLIPYRESYPDGEGVAAVPPPKGMSIGDAAEQLLESIANLDPERSDGRLVRTNWKRLADAVTAKCNGPEREGHTVRVTVQIAEFERDLLGRSVEVDLTHISF